MNNINIKPQRPSVVELVGLAGAGKTTLAKALGRRSEDVCVKEDLAFRSMEHLPIFIGNIPTLPSLYLRPSQNGRRFTWDEIKSIIYLKEWPRVLRNERRRDATVILDHGAVFKLATLNAFGPEQLHNANMESWWVRTLDQWSRTLDLIIWLNAPYETLIERINSREQRHAAKGKSSKQASRFLDAYLASYEHVLGRLFAQDGPQFLQFDTSQATAEKIADDILTLFNTASNTTQSISSSATLSLSYE